MEPAPARRQLRWNLLAISADGGFYSVMQGAGEMYFAAFRSCSAFLASLA